MPFQEIEPRKTKAMYVAKQILDTIKQGEYPVGSRLPPERLLAEQMKVSRNSVREALSALQIIGITESRTGEGTYVRNLVQDKVDIGQALSALKEGEELFEIWEARKEIESSLIRLAIDRINSNKVKTIHDILEKMREKTQKEDSVGYLKVNRDFHLAIANAADNVPLKNAFCALMEITTQQLLEKVNLGYVLESIKKSFQEHEDIYNAIKEQDKKAGIAAVETHFGELENYFGSKYQQKEAIKKKTRETIENESAMLETRQEFG